MSKRIDTLVIVRESGKVLLGMKKRGFGAGNWNGFGGKVKMGEEEVIHAAHRELEEEAGIRVGTLVERGILDFSFENDPSLLIECRVFEGTEIIGEPLESDEMRPEWFLEAEIPYKSMWQDDQHWLPLLLKGQEISGRFHFASDGAILHGKLNNIVL